MKKQGYQMNIGGASILLLLVVFAMTVFAVLSMRASYHEVKMAEKTRDSIQSYYNADAKVEDTKMLVAKIMGAAMKQTETSPIDYLKRNISEVENLEFDEASDILTCVIPMDYNKNIVTKLQIPNDFVDGYEVISQKMIVLEQEDYDFGDMEIWDGVIDD